MSVFISWSGLASQKIAEALKELIGVTVQSSRPWMSKQDIAAGADWSQEVSENLRRSTFGVIALTPENFEKPWIAYEAGALGEQAHRLGGLVCPMVFGMDVDAVRYPLKRFQCKTLEKGDVADLIKSINAAGKDPLHESVWRRALDGQWAAFQSALDAVELSGPKPKAPGTDERLAEIATTLAQMKAALERAALLNPEQIVDLVIRASSTALPLGTMGELVRPAPFLSTYKNPLTGAQTVYMSPAAPARTPEFLAPDLPPGQGASGAASASPSPSEGADEEDAVDDEHR